MKWYHYLASFFAGLFLANAIPHYVHGVAGDCFPSPFATPPGKGLSSPLLNTIWGLGNFLVGYILLRIGKVSREKFWSLVIFFIGVICISIMSSINFADKMH